MLSPVRVTEDAAVRKMKKKNSSHEAYLQGRKDRQQTNTYITYTVLRVMKRNKTSKGHMEMGVLVFIGGSGGPL